MDYNPQTLLIALVAHNEIEGGGNSNLTNFAQALFDRFNDLIVENSHDAGLSFDAEQRTVIASVALLFGGNDQDAAQEAVATYVDLFGS